MDSDDNFVVMLVNLTDECIKLNHPYLHMVPILPPQRNVKISIFLIGDLCNRFGTRNWRIGILKGGKDTNTHITGGSLLNHPEIIFKHSTVGKISNVFCIQGTRPVIENSTFCCCFEVVINMYPHNRPVFLIDWQHPAKETMLRSPTLQYDLWGVGGAPPVDCKDAREPKESRSKVVKPGQVLPIYTRFGN